MIQYKFYRVSENRSRVSVRARVSDSEVKLSAKVKVGEIHHPVIGLG